MIGHATSSSALASPANAMDYVLDVQNIECRYQQTIAVNDLSFAVAPGVIACLLGPSGCGKTTVLRAIAGFQALTQGEIRLNGQCVSSANFELAPEKRRLGMVFQDHALFPHMSVEANIATGLRQLNTKQKQLTVGEMLEKVGLSGFGKRYPHELSGGQQQRVALARALAPNPALLLMDEPFSNLDSAMREKVGLEVHELLKSQGATCVLVTHDQNDAFALGERVGVMDEGRIVQWDTPYNLYHEPNSHFIADFIGEGIFLPGELLAHDTVRTELGVTTGNRAYPWPTGTIVNVLIRPDDIVPDAHSQLRATVVRRAFKGAGILYTLKLSTGGTVLSLFPSHMSHEPGQTVSIRLAADHLVVFKNGV